MGHSICCFGSYKRDSRVNHSKLVLCGGHISIIRSWPKSLLTRMSFIRRKASSSKLSLFRVENLKQSYPERLKEAVLINSVVPQMEV